MTPTDGPPWLIITLGALGLAGTFLTAVIAPWITGKTKAAAPPPPPEPVAPKLEQQTNAAVSEVTGFVQQAIGDLQRRVGQHDERFGAADRRFDAVDDRFHEVNDSLQELWRSLPNRDNPERRRRT